MRIVCSWQGEEKVFEIEETPIVIGRQMEGAIVNLDLTPDLAVSRQHARIWEEGGEYWVADLASAGGTLLNSLNIKDKGPRQLRSGDRLIIGETSLTVHIPPKSSAAAPFASRPSELPEPQQPARLQENRTPQTIPVSLGEVDKMELVRRLALFYELPLQFGEETRLSALLQLIVERLVDVIPGAMRGALLVKDRQGRLALSAHLPPGSPAVSLTLAERAMEQRRAFIWPPPTDDASPCAPSDTSPVFSTVEYSIKSALYAPLLWKGKALGVVCVDSGGSSGSFDCEDLKLIQAVAHHASMSVSNLQLQEEWRQQLEVEQNFRRLISPQLAERLKQQRGRIRLGGDFREATILISDIRGFTNLSTLLSPQDVTEMLEDYFGQLVPLVSKHQGMVDKYIGDAILAVFGSPQDDPEHYLHAVQTALEMQAAIQDINARRAALNKLTVELGVGVHSGEIVHGFIGTPERMEFTVIGDTVNRTSRYCDGARGGEVLISPEVHQLIWNRIEVQQTSISTKHEGDLTAYRVLRLKPPRSGLVNEPSSN
jgi:adenylate cyclase